MNLIKRLRTRPTGDPHLHALVHEAADEIERQTNNADNLRQRVEDLTKECDALKTVMVAAAEEIQAHWSAHCDAEGYGPANLIRRLEEGIPSEYGYTAGAFERLTKERDALRQNAAMAQVCMDLHDALGVRFGDDPYAAIRALRLDAERYRKWRADYANTSAIPTNLGLALADTWTEDAIDATIDAARKEKP